MIQMVLLTVEGGEIYETYPKAHYAVRTTKEKNVD